jgi:SAM-dependent methyltransferase
MGKLIRLHLGCGNDYKKGYLNCDVCQESNPDKVVDLEKKLPFRDNSVIEIYTKHTLEHLTNFMQLMEEFHRICANGAKLKIIVPYFSHIGSFANPDHKRFFTFNTFSHFDINNKKNNYTKRFFKIKNKKLNFLISRPKLGKPISTLFNKFPSFYERFFAYLIPATEIEFELEVDK